MSDEPTLCANPDDQILVTRAELWKLGADLHAPGRALLLADDEKVFEVEDVRERLWAMASRPAVERPRED